MTVKTISTAYAGSYAFTPPTTELIVSATGSVAKGVSAGGTGTYTLINRGEVLNSGSTAAFCAVSFAGAGVVTNTGTIRSSTAGQGAGVVLAKGRQDRQRFGQRRYGPHQREFSSGPAASAPPGR